MGRRSVLEAVMNLVVGASGLLGAEICRRLAQQGKPVRALVRLSTDAAKQETLKSFGATLVYGDLKDRGTLDAGCLGAETVISTASATFSRQAGDSIESVDLNGQLNLLHAARVGGVRHFIYVSFPPFPGDFALQRAKRSMEKELTESGLGYTILQPTFFTEIWLSPAVGFDAANARAQIYGTGQSKVSWISYIDVAGFAAACVGNRAVENRVLKLGGPEALSPLEVVRIFEEEGGREISVTHVPEEALRAQREAATDSLQEAFVSLMLACAGGDAIDMKPVLGLFSVALYELRSVREYARRMLRPESA
jgi:NADH dehydrogenase